MLFDPITAREAVAFAVGVAGVSFVMRSGHAHEHVHEPLVHHHPHVPDLHHRHTHA